MNYGQNHESLPSELQDALRFLVEKYEKEDSWARRQLVKLWRRNEKFWHGLQYVFWSDVHEDWLLPSDNRLVDSSGGQREDVETPLYDFVTNIYRAHGESVIAALSTQVPAVRFPPDDADDAEDQMTSETYSKIADLIARHNKAKLVLMEALFYMWNEGLAVFYHCPKYDRAFGTLERPVYGKDLVCPMCGYRNDSTPEELTCPTCSSEDPETGMQSSVELQPEITGFDELEKRRVVIELYSSLYVKIPFTIKSQKDASYLICTVDQPVEYLRSLYPHARDMIGESSDSQSEIDVRSPVSIAAVGNEQNTVPLRRVWLRPWTFECIVEDDVREQLKKLFPDGAYCCFAGDTYLEARAEKLDDHWTIGKAGLSRFINSDPMGQPLISINEQRNVLGNLTLETIEHAIPAGFADPEVLDFDTWGKHEARPGMIYPAKPKVGQNLGQSFYESTKASLSQEVKEFAQQLDRDGQFVVGSFPSIYGGPGEGKSRTASEYNQSRLMALQRLSITWYMTNETWSRMMLKCVKLFIETMQEDKERYVTRSDNRYVNVWIDRAKLTGRIGDVETEGSDDFPISLGQKKQLLLDLLGMGNEFIETALFDPQNRQEIANLLSYPDLYIPGEDQRLLQMREIAEMQRGIPMEIDPEVDDHEIHASVVRSFLASPEGTDLKISNRQLWDIMKAHLSQHIQVLQQTQMQGEPPNAPSGNR